MSNPKVRPALVLAVHREELIILGIFSKIPDRSLQESCVLILGILPSGILTLVQNELKKALNIP